jgi:hypothetical protein
MYNMTSRQKDLLQRLVQKVRAGDIPEKFFIYNTSGRNFISGDYESRENILEIPN